MRDAGPPSVRVELVAAGALLVAAAALRLVGLELGWFGVDQARDVATALDVVAGRDLPLVGPTMRRVTRLGALYYYFWALPHLVSRDPLAAYAFAAVLGILTALVVWRLARRLWGAPAGLVALAVAAAHPVAVIDTRVAWSPAALPFIAVLLLWARLGAVGTAGRLPPLGAGRAAAVGALLGLAVQLHLSMVAWVIAAVVLLVIERPPPRALLAAVAAGLVVGAPALVAMGTAAAGEAGVHTVSQRAWPDLGHRLVAALALPWRVPRAFVEWPGWTPPGPTLRLAGVVLTAGILAGLGRLGTATLRGDPRARVLVVVAGVVGGIVLGLPGESWYYYLDSLLPVWALAVGALVAPPVRLGARPPRVAAPAAEPGRIPASAASEAGPGRLRSALALAAVAAAAVLALHVAGWLRAVARAGYTPLEPALLTLDARPGRDAAVAARLLTAGTKRRLARVLAPLPTDLAALWPRLHGPALGDALGDNGFWLWWQTTARPGAPMPGDGRQDPAPHFALFDRADPQARALAALAVEERGAAGARDRPRRLRGTAVGPILVVAYEPAIDYASCRAGDEPVAVPIRVVPHPRRYGDGTVARPASLPARLVCRLAPGTGWVQVVASLEGDAGDVRVRAGHAESGRDAAHGAPRPTATLCLQRGAAPVPFTVTIAVPAGAAAGLDLYDVPGGVGCPG